MLLIRISYCLTTVTCILLNAFYSYGCVPLHGSVCLFYINVRRFAHSFQWPYVSPSVSVVIWFVYISSQEEQHLCEYLAIIFLFVGPWVYLPYFPPMICWTFLKTSIYFKI